MQNKPSQLALRVCLIYCLTAGAWILFSDRLLHVLVRDPQQITHLQTYKGWAFVLVTGALLYGILHRLLRRWEAEADERKRGDAALQRVNRRLRMLSDCNQAVMRATDENALLKTVCQIAVAVGGYRLAWAGYAEDDEAKTVRPAAQAGFEAGYLETLHITWADTERGRGPVGMAIRTGRPCAFRNLAEDPSFAPWREEALRRGYSSAIALPLITDGRTFGTLNIYSGRSDAFDTDETDLLLELANDLAFGLSALRTRASHRQAEAELREKDLQVQIAVQGAGLGIWRFDFLANKLNTIRGSGPISGLPAPIYPLTIEAFYALIHPDDRERVREHIQRVAAGVDDYQAEFRIVLLNNNVRWVSAQGRCIRDADAKALALTGVDRDITARKRVEEELRESERKYRELVENANSIILRWTPDGRIMFLNEYGQKFFGYSAGEIFGQHMVGTITPETETSGRALRPLLDQISTDPKAFERSVNENLRYNGERVWVAWTNKAVLDAQGRVKEILSIGSDITGQRQLEEQLRQAQKMEAIGQLAGGVAHDFNNILCVIQMQSSLILERPEKAEDVAESTRQISQAAERAASLTRQLLMFGRKQFMQSADLNLNEIVANMAKMLQRLLGGHITLRSNPGPDLPLVHADASMIEQVIMNLAVNARDAMPKGGQLDISTSAAIHDETSAQQNPQARPGRFVCLSVTDTGHGIAPENLVRIFDPFFTTKEVGKGTGLGLATVYGIVHQHHGWIEVVSELNKGTAFRVLLPTTESVREEPPAAKVTTPIPGGAETILLVEDEGAVRRLMTNYLQRSGYTVLTAVSGIAALEVWREHQEKVDLLLTDMTMPDGLTGRELAEKFLNQKPGLKVIFTSGYSAETTDGEFKLREGHNFLQKPFSAQKLTQTVRTCLDQNCSEPPTR